MIMEEGEDFKAGLNGCKHRNPDVCVCLVVYLLDVDLCSQITSYVRRAQHPGYPSWADDVPARVFMPVPSTYTTSLRSVVESSL